MSPVPVITLLTDFGLTDPYVGIMKGVIASRCAAARVIDLTHDIPPQHVNAAAFALDSAWRYFPAGTVHVVVVDPGVGSDRAVLAAECGGHRFVAPDNGLLSAVFESNAPDRVVNVEAPEWFLKPLSRTFHGRDVFAPVAAALAMGVALGDLGPPPEGWVQQPAAAKVRVTDDGELIGQVVYIDRFGNAVTNIRGTALPIKPQVTAAGRRVGELVDSYAAAAEDEALTIIGSTGRLEIAVNRGSAAESLPLREGDEVRVSRGV